MGEQGFKVRLESGLVALDREQVIAAPLKEHLLRGLILGMHGVGDHDLAQEVLPAEQLTRGGDFVTLGRGHDAAQKASLRIHGIDDFHPGVTHFLAIHDDNPILARAQNLVLPA